MERSAPVEFRMEGRRLRGVALRYGEQALDRPEMFRSGAFQPLLHPIALNLQHDRSGLRELATTDGGSLQITDTPTELHVEAELREGSAELALVRRGALKGLSVEFRPLLESRQQAIRVIERAELGGIALVDAGSYRTDIELRQDLTFLRAVIPFGRVMACRCQGTECDSVLFEEGAFDHLGEKRDVLAVAGGGYGNVLGSLKRGTLRVRNVTAAALRAVGAVQRGVDKGVEIIVDRAITSVATEMIATATAAPIFVRPLINLSVSKYRDENRVRIFEEAHVDGLLVKPATTTDGMFPAVVQGVRSGPVPPAVAVATEPERRRMWL